MKKWQNSYGMAATNQWHNATAPSPQQAQATLAELNKLRDQIAKKKAERDAILAQTGCKKPIINVGKKKKEYEDCIRKSIDAKARAEQAERDLRRMELELKQKELSGRPKVLAGIENKLVRTIAIGVGVAVLVGASIIIIKNIKS